VQSGEAPRRVFFAVWCSCHIFLVFLRAYWFGSVVWYPVCTKLLNTHSLSFTYLVDSCNSFEDFFHANVAHGKRLPCGYYGVRNQSCRADGLCSKRRSMLRRSKPWGFEREHCPPPQLPPLQRWHLPQVQLQPQRSRPRPASPCPLVPGPMPPPAWSSSSPPPLRTSVSPSLITAYD